MTSKTVFEIEFKCGHVEDRDLSDKPAGERRRFADWLATTSCSSCWKRSAKRTQSKEFKARAEQESQAAREDQEKLGLPPLVGAEKQVAWGLTARYNLFRSAYDELVQSGDLTEQEFDDKLLTPAKRIDRAGWWIDNRAASASELLELVADPGDRASTGGNENPY